MRKRIGIFTTFYNFDPSYSLVSVVRDQLVAHVKHGYTPVLFVLESFEGDVPEGVEVRKVIPQIILEPYAGLGYPATWREDVERVRDAVRKHAGDIDIMITHDVVFIDCYLPYNIGLREAELPCRYFHWVHSAPSPRPQLDDNPHANRYTLPPNSKLVYLNHDKQVALAEMYGTYPRSVKVIHNSRDPRTFWGLDPFVNRLIDRHDLLSCDIISVYPLSTPRMISGKQLDVVIRIHEHLRKLGYTTKLIVPNAHANAEAEKEEVRKLSSPHVVFTSLEGEEYEHGVSAKIVSDLFRLSNVFIFPSTSENCSLVLLEAMLSGNLLVLNEDCSGLKEFGGANALYFKFGNFNMGVRTVEHAVERDEYVRDIAKIIRSEFEANPALQAKRATLQKHNYDVIFDQIESLYYEYPNSEVTNVYRGLQRDA